MFISETLSHNRKLSRDFCSQTIKTTTSKTLTCYFHLSLHIFHLWNVTLLHLLPPACGRKNRFECGLEDLNKCRSFIWKAQSLQHCFRMTPCHIHSSELNLFHRDNEEIGTIICIYCNSTPHLWNTLFSCTLLDPKDKTEITQPSIWHLPEASLTTGHPVPVLFSCCPGLLSANLGASISCWSG